MNTRRAVSSIEPRSVGPPRGRRPLASWWGAIVLGGVISSTSVSLAAQVRVVIDDRDPEEEVVAVERFVFSAQQFDQMVFGGGQRVVVEGAQRRVISDAPTVDGFRQQMESFLETEIRTVDTRCRLSDAQKKKLQLAGRGDVARWLSRVSELRQKVTAAPMDRQQYTALISQVQSLQYVRQSGPFGETSLLHKTLRRTLTDEQLPQYRALVRERSVKAVEVALTNWDRGATGIRLVGETRQKFIDTLVDNGSFPQTSTPYMYYIVLLEAGRLEDKLKPLMNETQWQSFQLQVNNAKRVEQTLRNSGQWPVAQPADDDSPPGAAKD